MRTKALCSSLLAPLLLVLSLSADAETYVIPFADIRQEIDGSNEDLDAAVRAYLISRIRNELDAQGFNVDAGLVFGEIAIDEFTETIATDCNFPRPYQVHADAAAATLTFDDSSSITLALDTIRSVSLQANLSGVITADTTAWVRWGQDVPFIGDCKTINTDHGWIGLIQPLTLGLDLQLDLNPTYDPDLVAIVVDKHATLTGQATFDGGIFQHDFGSISLTDLVIDVFEGDLLDTLKTSGEQAVADAIIALNYQLDGRDENGLPDPTITAFNVPTTYVFEADEEDQAFVSNVLQELGIPEIVLAMVDDRGVEILIQLALLEGAERDAYLEGLGAQISCDALLRSYRIPMDTVPLYALNAQLCEVADLSSQGATSYYSDSQCSSEVAFRPTDDLEFCLDQFGGEAESLLGNAAAWVPDTEQPGDELPDVASRAWTIVPSTALDMGTVSLHGNRQPFMKQLSYKTITDLPRGNGTCELEMRVYKSDVSEQGLRPLLALHGGTWQHRGTSFIGLEAGVSQFTEDGFVVFAPFYRLVGDSDGNTECNGATWREVTADVESALDWVAQNGAALGAGEDKVSVFGQSAGAHLAAWLVANRSQQLRKAVLYYGPTDALEFLAGGMPIGGPYEQYRDFGLRSLIRFFGAERGTDELRLELIDFEGLTVSALTDDWASVIPTGVFDLGAIEPLSPPGYVSRCASTTAIDLSAIDLLAPPIELLDCLKQALSEFLVQNSFNHQLSSEPVPVLVVHGSGDTLVPHAQAINLCAAIDGNALPIDVVNPLTVYACGEASEVHVVAEAEHTLDLGVCLPPLCPAGAPGTATREAAISAINSSYLWLKQDPPVPGVFNDVPAGHWAYPFIRTLALAGLTSGCGNNNFCPGDPVTRAEMAEFLELGINGAGYVPTAATGNVFIDVAPDDYAAAFIEQLAADRITAGCGGGRYCPAASITRDQMAVLLLRAKYGSSYSPPPAAGLFSDVPLNSWAVRWVEQLATEGITAGCGGGKYCPQSVVTRDQMAVFLVRTFGL